MTRDEMQMIDDGCPITHDETPAELTPRDLFVVPTCAARLARRHKNMIHGILLAAISITLILDGGKQADWLFVALAAITEVA